jgi:hypothetical protein
MSDKEKNPFNKNLDNDEDTEGLLDSDDLLSLNDFDSSFSVPKFSTKSNTYSNNFIESEELDEKQSVVEISKPEEDESKAEVYINRLKSGELESIEVVASNGERILIRFEIDDNNNEETNNENVEDTEKEIPNTNPEDELDIGDENIE